MDSLRLTDLLFRENETFLKSFSDGPKRDKGQLLLLLDLPDNPGAEDSIAEKIWRSLHDTFFNCESDDAYICFEEALKAVNSAVEQENQKRASGTIGRIHSVACLVQDQTMHFSQTGQAGVSLRRGTYYTQISDDSAEEQSFTDISSGEILGDDVVIFSTRPLPFDDETLKEVFSQKGSKISSELKSLAKKKEVTGLLSYLVVPDSKESPAADEDPFDEEELDTLMASEESSDNMPKEKDADLPETQTPARKKKKNKAQEALSSLSKKLPKGKVDDFKKTMKGIAEGMSSKMGKIIKKPERIKQVNRRYILLALIALVVVLGLLLSWQSSYRQRVEEANYYESLLEQVKNNISIAENRFLIGEKKDATEFLTKAETDLKQIETAGFYANDVQNLTEEISLYRDNFDAIIRASNPNIFADLSQKGTVDAIGIIHTEDQKNFIYEPRRLFETILDKVQEPLSIDNEEVVLTGVELSDFNVLSFVTQSGQVIEYSVRNGRFETASTQDDTWNKGVDIKSYNGEFVYLLDPPSNSIWKYQRLRTGYGRASTYSSQGDLSNAVSLAIDGDIYVLLRDGTILKYRRGELQPFEVQGQPTVPLRNPSRIFTLPEANNIYVLDSANKRVVVYSKDQSGVSNYEKQVVFDTLEPNEIKDFYVDKDEQKLVVLTADKIYITDL